MFVIKRINVFYMKECIIGIAGHKNSGKDTVASMINYIFVTGITRSNYADYVIRRKSIDISHKDRIIHFADSMKDAMSIIFSIPRSAFDDRVKKDNEYWDYFNRKFITFGEVIRDKNYYIVSNLIDNNLNNVIQYSAAKKQNLYIKLRALMQYFGTDICRNYIDNNIWINSTMSKVIDTAITRTLCIIPDVRFANEANAIRNNDKLLYGGLIKINRDNQDLDEHNSERINFDVDFEIDNNGNLMQLFYKVLEICQKIK